MTNFVCKNTKNQKSHQQSLFKLGLSTAHVEVREHEQLNSPAFFIASFFAITYSKR